MKAIYTLAGTLAFAFAIAQSSLEITLLDPNPRPNLVRNSSFEAIRDGLPIGWSWEPRNTQATLAVVSEPGAMGTYCLRFTNPTLPAPGEYALLRYDGGVPVKPSTIYTLSCRYKTRADGVGFIGGGQNRRVRLAFENTNDQWKTASLTFATRDDETEFELIVVIEVPTESLCLDAIKLEEHSEATPYVPAETVRQALITPPSLPSTIYVSERHWQTEFEIYTPQPLVGANLQVQLGREQVLQRVDLPAGVSRARVCLRAPRESQTTLTVRLHHAGQSVSVEHPVSFFTRVQAESRLKALRSRIPRWQRQIQLLQRNGQDIAYPQASWAVLKAFVEYIADDLRKGLIERVHAPLEEMEAIASRLETTLKEGLAGQRRFPVVPRYLGSPITVKGTSLMTEVENPLTGARQQQPFFFVGFGASNAELYDLEKFSQMGFHLVQIERGVQDLFSEPAKASSDVLEREMLPLFERAQRANLKVDLLLRPHALPEWLYQSHPDLKQPGASLFSPDSLKVLRDYLLAPLSALSRQPALFSVGFATEPVDGESPLPLQAWRRWLQQRHKSLLTLNTRWRTAYTEWDAIPIPTEGAPYAEWLEFRADAVAQWYQQVVQLTDELFPNTPQYVSLPHRAFLDDRELPQGIDPQRFAVFCDWNGHSASNAYVGDPSRPWAFDWIPTWMAYDFQRSLKEAPLHTSQYHLVPADASGASLPAYARAVLWESVLRGVSSVVFGSWRRASEDGSAGILRDHPALIEALAHTTLDLNRLAPYLAVLQNQPFEVHLLYARTDLALHGPEQIIPRDSLYIALTMLGVRVGFVTEQQLIAGRVPEPVKRILIPNVQSLSDEAFFALDQLRQRRGVLLLGLGEPLLVNDLYGRRRTTRPVVQTIERNPEISPNALQRKLNAQLQGWGIERPLRLLQADTDEPAWGIAYRTAPYDGGYIASLCNYTHHPITVRLVDPEGNPIKAVNLIDGCSVEGTATLAPLELLLIRW